VQSIAYSGGGLSHTQSFGYDALNRLTTSNENSGASWSQTNGYDQYGNRWIDYGGGVHNLSFNTSTNRITNSGFSYDSAGNLTNDTIHAYTFDAENKISKVDNVPTYVYDGEGQRVKKLIGENTRFIYGIGGQLVAEFDGATGNLQKEYVQAGETLITIEPTAVNSNGARYTTSDHLGSPRVVTNSSAGVVSRHDLMPFGEELSAGVGGRTIAMGFGVTDNLRQRFTGQPRDTETGLDFFSARYYASTQGRFTSTDPLQASAHPARPQTWNRYAYVLNNPLRMVDPSGMAGIENDSFYGGDMNLDPQQPRPARRNGDPIPSSPNGSESGVIARVTVPISPATTEPIQTNETPIATRVEMRPTEAPSPIPGNAGAPTFRGVSFGLSAGLIGGTINVKRDKFGNWYISGGPSFGLSTPVNGSVILGGDTWQNGVPVTDERGVRNILSGPSAGVTGALAGPGMGGSWNTTLLGFFTTPIPTGANGTVYAQVGTPEVSYSPQLTFRVPRLKW